MRLFRSLRKADKEINIEGLRWEEEGMSLEYKKGKTELGRSEKLSTNPVGTSVLPGAKRPPEKSLALCKCWKGSRTCCGWKMSANSTPYRWKSSAFLSHQIIKHFYVSKMYFGDVIIPTLCEFSEERFAVRSSRIQMCSPKHLYHLSGLVNHRNYLYKWNLTINSHAVKKLRIPLLV